MDSMDVEGMFAAHVGAGRGKGKFALVLADEGDGDYALLEVVKDGSGEEVRFLGIICGDDSAEELARLIRLAASGECTCSMEDDGEVAGVIARKFRGTDG